MAKTRIFVLRLTNSQYERIKNYSDVLGINMSEYFRNIALENNPLSVSKILEIHNMVKALHSKLIKKGK